MNDDTQTMLTFYQAFLANEELQELLPSAPSASELARTLKNYAFQEMMYCNPASHHFLVALLDTMDWTLLAVRLLASSPSSIREAALDGVPTYEVAYTATYSSPGNYLGD